MVVKKGDENAAEAAATTAALSSLLDLDDGDGDGDGSDIDISSTNNIERSDNAIDNDGSAMSKTMDANRNRNAVEEELPHVPFESQDNSSPTPHQNVDGLHTHTHTHVNLHSHSHSDSDSSDADTTNNNDANDINATTIIGELPKKKKTTKNKTKKKKKSQRPSKQQSQTQSQSQSQSQLSTKPLATKPPPPKQTQQKSQEDDALIRLALHRNPYFTCLDEEQIERFVDEAELVQDFRPGQAVIVEGPASASASTAPSTSIIPKKSNSNSNSNSTKLRRWKTNSTDVDGGDYFEGAAATKTTTMGDPADVDDLWWLEDSDDSDDNDDADNNNNNDNDTENDNNDDKDETLTSSAGAAVVAKSSYLYVIRKGKADVFYESINPATLGPSKMFGEGGFLFGRHHSASVVAATDQLECFRVDRHTFVHKILPSHNMKRLYRKYASTSSSSELETQEKGRKSKSKSGEEKFFMTMDDFLEFFKKERGGSPGDTTSTSSSSSSLGSSPASSSSSSSSSPSLSPIANAYQSILRGTSSTYHDEKNHITLEDFCFFHFLMARPDPEVDIAFILMDRSRAGTITQSDFEQYLKKSVPYFDREGEFIKRHFGQNRVIRAHQFSQFLHDLQRELGKQAFLHRVQTLALEKERHEKASMTDPHIGYLPAETFIDVLKSTSSWRLPDGVIDRLESLYCKPSIDSAESTALASVRAGTIKGDSPKQVAEYSKRSVLADLERRRNKLGTRHFAYVDFIAFQDLLVQLPAICNLIERSCQIKKGPISPDDFKVANRVLGIGGRLSRQQVNIVFDLFDLDHDGYLSNEDAISVCGLEVGSNALEAVEGRDGKSTFAPPPNYPQNYSSASDGFGYNDDGRPQENMPMKEWMMTQTTQFLLSSIAGGFGIFTVYPLDLIKTRMMNQRAPGVQGTRLYQTSLDCLQKIVRYEGAQGLYRGLLPPLLAAGPEKFVKFTLNDMLRAVLSKDDGSSSSTTQWITEIVSGGCAGACQLLVTNPLEVVKIRMQMQGETAKVFQDKGFRVPKGLGLHYMSFTEIIRECGMTGLYKGAAACLMRDIPFGAIYFPAYAACMDYFVNREGSAGASSSNILVSGTLAAVPASLLTNPMDLVKTRMQVASRPGEEVYSGIGDCIRKVHQTEGIAAFFKGSFPRVARIAPQFGLSLFAYEKVSQVIGFRGIAPPTNAPVNPRDYRTAFSSVSSGIESKAIDAESLIENIGLFKPPR